MSPNGQMRGKKIKPSDNLYTVILTVAFTAVLATTVFVAVMCYLRYGTFTPP